MAQRPKKRGVYQRGDFWLDHDRHADGRLRSPYYTIFWYDRDRRRTCTASTGESNLGAARQALDRHYLTHSEGELICPACGQSRAGAGDASALRVVIDYLTIKEDAASIKALRPRLNHVVRYIGEIGAPDVRCGRIDEAWVGRFRTWLAGQPVVSTAGGTREKPRKASSIENSVIALAAAINAAHRRGDISRPAQFKPIPTTDLNQTPQRRLSIDELAQAFAYASDPTYPVKRLGLRRFLMFSVGTLARPDAAHDFSTSPERRQWHPERHVVALNPAGRKQTRKRRAIVIAPRQLATRIEETSGRFIPFVSVKSAWETMVDRLEWPRDGEGGMKLVRRSVAQLLRDAGTQRAWSDEWRRPERKVPREQIEVQLGHRAIASVTDLYAFFDPEYQREATGALEAIIDSIIERVPNAFGSDAIGAVEVPANEADPETVS